MKASERHADPNDASSETGNQRAGGGRTTADLPARPGGRPGGLPFMDVQLKSAEEEGGGNLWDPVEMARTGPIEVAEMFFGQATTRQRIEIIEARRPTYERVQLLRSISREDMNQVVRHLPDHVKRTLLNGDDGLDDRMSPETVAEILNATGRRNLYSQPKLTLTQMMAVLPMLESELRPMLLLANEAHATPVLNAIDDGELGEMLRGMKTLPVIARRIVDNLPGHLRDRVRKAIEEDASLASLMPADSSTDADMARSQTDPDKAWLWDASFTDHGSKSVPSSEDWSQMPESVRLPLFVAATIDKRVSYLSKDVEGKGRLLRALDAENRVQTVLAFVKKFPRKRSMLSDLKAEDIIPVIAGGAAEPADAAALFLASSYGEQQLIGPVMTPLQVAALLSVDDIEHAWIKAWSNVPDTLLAAAFRRMDLDKLETLFFYAGDSAARMRAMLPEGHPLAQRPSSAGTS